MLQNGLLSSLPYLGKYVFAVLTSALADYCLRTDRLSRTAIRKIFTAFGKEPVLTAVPACSVNISFALTARSFVKVIIFLPALSVKFSYKV
jgi:ACS family sodium-dependent inorganic phosphate cotransporter